MSGIAGILRRDGNPAQDRDLRAMVDSIAHRGPDGNKLWCSGVAGFGHAMLYTTPESLVETLPWYESRSRLCITADARIDNRLELTTALGLEAPSTDLSDSRLILYAYEKWGKDCPKHLVGDFVFAIWDERTGQVFCARDPMGIKCLYYFASRNLFAFASEIKGLRCLEEVPDRLNELRVLDHLANIFDDREITFYKDIYRLPAASTLTVARDSFKIGKYWTLDSVQELKLRSDEEYTEAFRECFLKSVTSRIRSAFPVGAALSGGLDSSSIACAASQIGAAGGSTAPFPTFSLTFPSLPENFLGEIDERNYMEAVLSQGGFDPTFIRADQISPLRNVESVQHHLDEAFAEGNLYLHWAMYQEVRRKGVRVFLDGTDGDTTVSHGMEHLADLAVSGKWVKLNKEVGQLAMRAGASRRRIFREYCIKPFCPTWVFGAWRRLHGRPAEVGVLKSFMAPKFSTRLKLTERVAALICTSRHCFASAREKHRAMLMSPLYAHALEVADKSAAAFGVEARYPFFDQRLIELCVSLPSGQKLSDGWNRAILRRAMGGILPEAIRWRPSKANLSANFYLRLLDHDRELLDDVLLKNSSDLEPYVDLASIRSAYRDYQSDPLRSHNDCLNIFSAVSLAVWLRTAGVRP